MPRREWTRSPALGLESELGRAGLGWGHRERHDTRQEVGTQGCTYMESGYCVVTRNELELAR